MHRLHTDLTDVAGVAPPQTTSPRRAVTAHRCDLDDADTLTRA